MVSMDESRLRNPFRPPCWRWLLAGEILEGLHADMDDSDDEMQALVAFRAHLDTPEAINSDHPALATAYKIFTENGPQRWELEARLIARQADSEIAQRIGLTAETVATYVATFCDVRGKLSAVGYLLRHCVGGGVQRGFRNDEIPAFWKWAAMAGGPLIVDTLTETFHSLHRPPEPATLGLYLKADAGIAPNLQAFVSSVALPPDGPAAAVWQELRFRLMEADASEDRERRALLRERVRDHLIRTARAFLAGKRLPKFRRQTAAAAKGPVPGDKPQNGIRPAGIKNVPLTNQPKASFSPSTGKS